MLKIAIANFYKIITTLLQHFNKVAHGIRVLGRDLRYRKLKPKVQSILLESAAGMFNITMIG